MCVWLTEDSTRADTASSGITGSATQVFATLSAAPVATGSQGCAFPPDPKHTQGTSFTDLRHLIP